MRSETACLVVLQVSDSFSQIWDELARQAGLELVRVDEPGAIEPGRVAALIVACGGAEGEAVDWLHRVHRAGFDGPLFVVAEPDHRLAVELMRRGAADMFALPGDQERLRSELVGRGTVAAKRGAAAGACAEEPDRDPDFSAIMGDDPTLRRSLETAARVIPAARTTVLVTGETGTGKELLAQAIHANGPRAREPLVAVNCSAIPANLLESELFGHEKGAFTGAATSKPGLFEVADGGTLFLDEVATLPLELQAKLLRALESGEIRRVGGVKEILVDVRILAAANVDLLERVRAGQFREDLYYRLAVVTLHLPALRERGDDVLLLARTFLARLAEEYGTEPPELTREALAALRRHPWPGNVRELRNAVERALLLSGGSPIRPEHLALSDPARTGAPGRQGGRPGALPFPASIREIERAAAVEAVRVCDGNKSEAARLLGTTRSRLYRLLDEAGDADG